MEIPDTTHISSGILERVWVGGAPWRVARVSETIYSQKICWTPCQMPVIMSVRTEGKMSVARKKIQKIGNSAAVLLTNSVMREAGFQPSDEVMIHAEKGRVTLTLLDPEFDTLMRIGDAVIADHANALRKLAE